MSVIAKITSVKILIIFYHCSCFFHLSSPTRTPSNRLTFCNSRCAGISLDREHLTWVLTRLLPRIRPLAIMISTGLKRESTSPQIRLNTLFHKRFRLLPLTSSIKSPCIRERWSLLHRQRSVKLPTNKKSSTLALYGGFYVSILTSYFSAYFGFLVGGSLIESLTSLWGSMTLPAFLH